MKKNTGYFEGREVTKLFYQSWLPDGDVKAYLITIHDLGTHSDRLSTPAEYFTEKGYAIYSFDLRGHWRNDYNNPGHIDSMDHLQKDIILFMDVVKNDAKDQKIFLMGHSFGGLICLNYAITHPGLPGVLVSSPSLGFVMESLVGKRIAKKLASSVAKLAPNKVFELNIDQNQLTSDLKILRKHIADKNKLNIITGKTIAEINSSMKWVMTNASKLTCPTFFMQAANDKIVDKKKSKDFFNNIKSKDKTYREYAGFLHELWNEKGRAQVFQDMYVWLEKHLK
jgi:alpha-beta hydrolase superfamily lysophospholipase